MERNFYNEEFEDLIREKADQYKIYPSDKVWNNIYSSLHARRRWYVATMFFLITGILFFAGKELLLPSNFHAHSNNNVIAAKKIADNVSSNEPEKNIVETHIAPAFEEFKPSSSPGDKALNGEGQSTESYSENNIQQDQNNPSSVFLDNTDADEIRPHFEFSARQIINVPETKKPSVNSKNDNISSAKPDDLVSPLSAISANDKKQNSLLQTTAPYELTTIKKLNRKHLEFYFSPTVNYRTLSGAAISTNQKPNIQNGPIAATVGNGNPNQYTNNTPAIGFEIGSSFLYRFTRNLSFKAGLQFNYSRYTINAYASNTQPATISLYSINGYTPNAITSYTNIGNIGGQAAVNLQNQYLQLSVPIGFELRILGNEKLQLNIGATVQPTYLMNRDSYLLTADYLNYTQEPSLFRRWNVNGAVEAFVTYKTGKVRWQIGPEFRYQFLSTYTSQYPLNENLKGLGVKIGMSKTIW